VSYIFHIKKHCVLLLSPIGQTNGFSQKINLHSNFRIFYKEFEFNLKRFRKTKYQTFMELISSKRTLNLTHYVINLLNFKVESNHYVFNFNEDKFFIS
jgi:hypothetical protein